MRWFAKIRRWFYGRPVDEMDAEAVMNQNRLVEKVNNDMGTLPGGAPRRELPGERDRTW